MKKVLILSGSPRKDGNSDLLCSEFMRGAQESGNEVQKIFVRSKKIVPCNACYYCRDHGGKCALNDDMSEILDAMQAADVIVMASPAPVAAAVAEYRYPENHRPGRSGIANRW